ncbi:family 2 encapsulin nanocompartment cargo protein polyprenyl transferase [Nocardiopsis sp. RSe5-2]|uniref:Family 2 encapsulin nanocompartment cargo protein polyprenyl transferase n=1 Tax=Nocardiopsis endophytica TaxID=3018445 RepID=A0ABT4UCT5_9ACTN|nr:family 2 encapsulin nanocompartment cargo protein polyprenyl transferase [Nocardiopsis endophytica]MDA2814740.1 family 2 encapsulin nanocompartment cargo protein polyprenyl transferase [Nocardiopsis endophytica]
MSPTESATEPTSPAPPAAGGPPPRSAAGVLSDSRDLVVPALREAVEGLPPAMRRIAGYHFGWCDGDGAPVAEGGGKALRPALVLLAAEAVGGDPRRALPAAAAVELVHNFSLLHDDVMDGDTTRRHRPTAWTVFGAGPAVLAGDALLTLAFEEVSRGGSQVGAHRAAEAGRVLASSVQDLIGGQSADLSFERRGDVDLVECLAMARGKTGALMACCTALGALWAGAGPARVGAMRDFGADLGLSFQIADDLLGIWGDPEVTGKPVHSDLRSRKKTLPVVAAVASGTAAGDELHALMAGHERLSDAEAERAAGLVEEAGGRSWAVDRADALLENALEALRTAVPHGRHREELASLARLAAHRDG